MTKQEEQAYYPRKKTKHNLQNNEEIILRFLRFNYGNILL